MSDSRTRLVFAVAFAAALSLSGCRQRPLASEVLAIVPTAASLHQVGEFVSADSSLAAVDGESGWLHYGPYAQFEPQPLSVEFSIDAEGPANTALGAVEVNLTTPEVPETIVATRAFESGRGQIVVLDFEPKAQAKYEFRVRTSGAGAVTLRKILIVRR